ncbi:654_t:CDS:1, partial [Scutellospora calospora]
RSTDSSSTTALIIPPIITPAPTPTPTKPTSHISSELPITSLQPTPSYKAFLPNSGGNVKSSWFKDMEIW